SIAEKVDEQIDELPSEETIKLSDKEKVSSARKAFEALTQNQKKLVTNINKLETLENRLEILEKEAADKNAANKVSSAIDALPTKTDLSLSDKPEVEKARKAYDNLTKAQQKFITNLEKLTSLESQLKVLEKEAVNKDAAKEVSSAIDALPSKSALTLSDKSDVEKTRDAYESLTKEQQRLVSNLEKLTSLESQLEVLEKEAVDKDAAKEVSSAI